MNCLVGCSARHVELSKAFNRCASGKGSFSMRVLKFDSELGGKLSFRSSTTSLSVHGRDNRPTN